ncbi:MAG: hypothetical protein WA102_10200 [Candidatus Methanoperedens sp.]
MGKLIQDARSALKEDRNISLKKTIEDLSYLGEDFVESNYKYHMSYLTEELRYIGLESVEKEWPYETFFTLTGLNNIGKKIVEITPNENAQNENYNFLDVKKVLEALSDIGLKTVEKKLGTADMPIAYNAIDYIKEIGVKSVQSELSILSESALGGILKIGIKAVETDLKMGVDPHGFYNYTRDFLIEIGIEADKKDSLEEITKKSMQSLWVLSAIIQKYQREPKEWADKLNKKLNGFKLNNEVANILFQSGFDNAKRIHQDLTTEIESFKEIYDAYCNRTPK